MRNTVTLAGASLIAFVAELGAMPAMAQTISGQDDQSASVAAGDDIVVTARRKDERLLDVPVAVTALSGDSLEEQRIDNVEALRFVAPALQVSPTAWGKSVPGFTIRSQRSLESIITQDPAVGIYFADVVQQRSHGTNGALYDLASVEVLKGPQGTLFGRNTTGGAILINPAKPTFDFEGSVQVEAGNYDLRRGTAVLNVPLSGKLAIRAAGQITRRDGFVKNVLTDTELDDLRTESGRVSLLWEPSDIFSSYFVANYFHQDDNGTAFGIAQLDPDGIAATVPEMLASYNRALARSDFYTVENNRASSAFVRSWSISNTSTLELGEVTLKNIFGYRKVHNFVEFDFDGTPASFFESQVRLKAHQWTEELQISGNASDRLNYIAGAFYFRERGRDTQDSLLFGTRSNDGEGLNESYSVYAQIGYELADRLTLTVGGRYTWDDRTLTAFNTLNGVCRLVDETGTPLDPCLKQFNKLFTSPSWLVSLDYKPTSETLLYVSHRRGYRSGGWNLRSNRPTDQIPFNPEDVFDIEVGAKGSLLDNRLTFSAAAYYQWYKGIQRTVSFPPAPGAPLATTVLNAADAQIKGFEFEASARPMPLLEFSGSVAHTDAQYSDFTLFDGTDLSANAFAMAPKWTYTLRGKVIAPLDETLGELSFGASYYHQSSFFVTDSNIGTPPIAAYGTFDLFADWRGIAGSPIDIGAFVKNLTKKEYYTGGVGFYNAAGYDAQTFGEPRTFGVSVKYRFGAMADS